MLNSYDEILKVHEVAEILGIGRNTVYALINIGKLDGFRTGKTWKVPKESLIKYICNEAGLNLHSLYS